MCRVTRQGEARRGAARLGQAMTRIVLCNEAWRGAARPGRAGPGKAMTGIVQTQNGAW